jgi:hypothetical protein
MSTKTGKLAAAGLMTLLLCLSQFPVPVQAQSVALASGAVSGGQTLAASTAIVAATSLRRYLSPLIQNEQTQP